jgi:hypothetical protein
MKMKRILWMVAVAMMAVLGAQAQKIEVVDAEGHGIPLVSVLTEDGNLIGTTDLNGVVNDVKGAAKVAVTHVAFHPQLVSIASLNNGRITMEALDYELQEIVVKPKPYIYVETYYRAYAFMNDFQSSAGVVAFNRRSRFSFLANASESPLMRRR